MCTCDTRVTGVNKNKNHDIEITCISIYHTSVYYFPVRWLASSEVISQVLFTSKQRKKNKMASRFASVSEQEILSVNEKDVPKLKNGNKV